MSIKKLDGILVLLFFILFGAIGYKAEYDNLAGIAMLMFAIFALLGNEVFKKLEHLEDCYKSRASYSEDQEIRIKELKEYVEDLKEEIGGLKEDKIKMEQLLYE